MCKFVAILLLQLHIHKVSARSARYYLKTQCGVSLAYVDSNFEFVPHDDTQLSAAVEKAKRGAASLTRPSRTQL